MLLKVFLLGRPGCGKSRAAMYILHYLSIKGEKPRRFKDYDILYDMFQVDKEHRRFRAIEYGGFEVIEESVLEEAIRELVSRIDTHLAATEDDTPIIIELARKNYQEVLRQFPPHLLQNAYFICVEADVEICKQRIRRRIQEPSREDNHFISDYTMSHFYTEQLFFKDDESDVKGEYKVIRNEGSLQDFEKQLEELIVKLQEML